MDAEQERLASGRFGKKPKTNRQRDDIEPLLRSLAYDKDTGFVTWRIAVSSHKAGERAGKVKGRGYRYIESGGFTYQEHRVAWLLVTGEWPPGIIDHVNRNGCDNRWANLRLATRAQNNWNTGPRANNSTGIKGVAMRANGRFYARIRANGVVHSLGGFITAAEAAQAYADAAKRLHGEFARTE